jgi:gas vesicle protein
MADNSGRLLFFITGAAIGATVTLLFAPQTGEQTRRYLKKKARRGGEALSEAGRDALDKGHELYKKGKRVADDAAELFERGRGMMEG